MRVATWLRLGFWVVLAVATIEVAARVDDWVTQGASPFGNYDVSIIQDYDALGPRGKPGSRFGKWRINSDGYRGPDLKPGTTRILTLGASETFGLYESENHEWPQLLAAELNRRLARPVYQAANAASAGETFATTIKRLPGHLNAVRPAAAVIYPSFANYLVVPFLSGPPRAAPRQRFQLRLEARVKQLLKEALPDPVQTRIRAWQTERAAKQYKEIWTDMPAALQRRFREEMEQAIGILRDHGVEVFLVTHTTRFGERVAPDERDMLISWRKSYPMLAEEGFLPMERTMNDILRETGKRMGVHVIDVVREMPAGRRYYSDFVHFTDEGAERFAHLVAEGMIRTATSAAFRGPAPDQASISP